MTSPNSVDPAFAYGSFSREGFRDGPSGSLAAWFSDFIDWPRRRAGEAGFLENTLRRFSANRIFEACLGEGCDTLHLLGRGFQVEANEIDPAYEALARENAGWLGLDLKVHHLDWRNLLEGLDPGSFDAVTCRGNSICLLLDPEDHLRVLRNFRAILKPSQPLLIDERNFQYMLDEREAIMAGRFRYSGRYVYCGIKVRGVPLSISDSSVVFQYLNFDESLRDSLTMYPFRTGELKGCLREAGFTNIEQYSDYRPGYNPRADYFTYVCWK